MTKLIRLYWIYIAQSAGLFAVFYSGFLLLKYISDPADFLATGGYGSGMISAYTFLGPLVMMISYTNSGAQMALSMGETRGRLAAQFSVLSLASALAQTLALFAAERVLALAFGYEPMPLLSWAGLLVMALGCGQVGLLFGAVSARFTTRAAVVSTVLLCVVGTALGIALVVNYFLGGFMYSLISGTSEAGLYALIAAIVAAVWLACTAACHLLFKRLTVRG